MIWWKEEKTLSPVNRKQKIPLLKEFGSCNDVDGIHPSINFFGNI